MAHSLGLDPELAMDVGKRQAKENCVKFLVATCLSQYGRYLAVSGAGAAAVGAGLEAQKHIAQALKKDSSDGSSSSSQNLGKTPPPDPGNHGGDGNGPGNGPKIAAGAGGLGVASGKKLGQKTSPSHQSEGFKGSKGFELKNASYQKTRNTPTRIGDREYSGHAVDQMQNRGIPPSVVENTIKNGTLSSIRDGGRKFYDAANDMSVVVSDTTGRVITIMFGGK